MASPFEKLESAKRSMIICGSKRSIGIPPPPFPTGAHRRYGLGSPEWIRTCALLTTHSFLDDRPVVMKTLEAVPRAALSERERWSLLRLRKAENAMRSKTRCAKGVALYKLC